MPERTAAREDLAAAVHDATNALTVILGWIERARGECVDRPGARSALDRAARYAAAAKDSMRRAIGAEVPHQAPELIAPLVERTVEDLAIEARRRQIEIRTSVTRECTLAVVPDPDAVWQILTNLLLNAIAVSPAQGSVTLSAAIVARRAPDTELGDPPAPERISLRVRDQGPGIDEAHRAAVFSGGRSSRAGGAGIGLRHAHALAAELGGELSLLDGDAGASFELLWPLGASLADHAVVRASPAEDAALRASLDGTRVLLLEDDPAVTELLELSLSARGATVTSVASEPALFAAIAEGQYDVLLMDLSPLEDGLDRALERARAANPRVEVVVISGSVGALSGDEHEAEPRTDVLWVRKPFEPKELVAALVRQRRTTDA